MRITVNDVKRLRVSRIPRSEAAEAKIVLDILSQVEIGPWSEERIQEIRRETLRMLRSR